MNASVLWPVDDFALEKSLCAESKAFVALLPFAGRLGGYTDQGVILVDKSPRY